VPAQEKQAVTSSSLFRRTLSQLFMLYRGRTSTVVTAFCCICLAGHLIFACTAAAQSKQVVLGPAGTLWGGQHVSLEVTEDGAQLEFDCANGTLPKALAIDNKGNFTTKGQFTREHPGPVMRDGNQTAEATYSGTLAGNTLHLHVVAGPQNDSVGDYVLVRDQPGRVMKCK
jgi:hypothetical protein